MRNALGVLQQQVSHEGVSLIERFEGVRLAPAKMPDGRRIVGFGHVLADDEPSREITNAEAFALLRQDLKAAEEAVRANVTAPLEQAQFDALVSLAYSIGREAFAGSDVVRRLKKGDYVAAADAIEAWRRSGSDEGKRVSSALVIRRAAEKSLFLSAVQVDPAPSALVLPVPDHVIALASAPTERAATPPLAPVAIPGPVCEDAHTPIASAPRESPRTQNPRGWGQRIGICMLGLFGAGLLAFGAMGMGGASGEAVALVLFGAPGLLAIGNALYFMFANPVE